MRRVTALATAAATLATLGLTSLGLGPGGSVAPSAYAASVEQVRVSDGWPMFVGRLEGVLGHTFGQRTMVSTTR